MHSAKAFQNFWRVFHILTNYNKKRHVTYIITERHERIILKYYNKKGFFWQKTAGRVWGISDSRKKTCF